MKLKSIIFDMDGVLWKDDTPLTNLKALFTKLEKAAIRVAFATNNSTRTPQEYQKKLADFGVNIHAEQVFTSGTNMAAFLIEKFPNGGPLFIIGESGLIDILQQAGFYFCKRDVLAVVGGLDRSVNYAQLRQATLLINQGAPFYYTNPDPSFPSPEGNIPGAGAIMAAIEAASGVKAITPGKPEPFMFLNALNYLESSAEETLVIGDRLDTDILGGMNAGCRTSLVLTGITRENELASSSIQPDYVFNSLSEFLNAFEAANWEVF